MCESFLDMLFGVINYSRYIILVFLSNILRCHDRVSIDLMYRFVKSDTLGS